MNLKNEKYYGFTLTELLIVVAIIIILAVISMYLTYAQIYKGYDARRKTDVRQIQIALEEYEKDHNCYPPSLSFCGSAGVLQNYIPFIPCDPKFKTPYVYIPGPDGAECFKWYWIFLDLQYDQDRQIEEVGCQNGCGPNAENAVFDYYFPAPGAPKPFGVQDSTEEVDTTEKNWGCFGTSCLQNVEWRVDINNWACQPNFNMEGCAGNCTDANPDFQCNPI